MRAHTAGFTLIELIITMSITTVVVAFAALFINGPIKGFTDQVRRAELVDSAESSLRRMGRDIRRALPNSVRVRDTGSIKALELLNAVEGIRYRAGPPPGNTNAWLSLSAADGAFNSIGLFDSITKPFSSTTHYLSVYNVGVVGASAYELLNVITPVGTQIDIDAATEAGEDNIVLTPAFQFAYPSPRQRVYLIDTPVSYLCDTAAGTLTRYSYTMTRPRHRSIGPVAYRQHDLYLYLYARHGATRRPGNAVTDRNPGRREYCAVATGAYRQCSLEI